MQDEQKDLTSNDYNEDYINTINELKKNTVSKDLYEKVREDNKKLLESFVNGSADANLQEALKKRSCEEIRKDLFKEDLTNLQYASYALELRDKIIEDGGVDPFLPVGKEIVLTDIDYASANRVAECLKDCIEYAEGDSAVFTNELQRRTRDVNIPRRR